MNLPEPIAGRVRAVQSLAQFIRYFNNWDEVWAAYRRGASRPMPPLKFRGGLTLQHGAADDPLGLFREVFVLRPYVSGGFYRPRRDHVVVDLGANIGSFALFMQWCAPGIRVHCFEPGGYALDLLKKNVALNRLDSAVTIHSCAVSDRNGFAYLSDEPRSTHRGLEPGACNGSAAGEKVETVDLQRVLELCRTRHVDLLKMDIEGSEYDIVLSTPAQLWKQIDRVVLEFHEFVHPDCREVVAARLGEAGFNAIRVVVYTPGALGILQASRA
jgi:FkbM family methyltransferase